MQSAWRTACILSLLLLLLGANEKPGDHLTLQDTNPVELEDSFHGQGFLPSPVNLPNPVLVTTGDQSSNHPKPAPWKCPPDQEVMLQVVTRLFMENKPQLLQMQIYPWPVFGEDPDPSQA